MFSLRKGLLAASVVAAMGAGLANAAEDVMVVYDASGSMWGQIDGVTKIEIARDVMAGLVESWDENVNVGLIAYGHRREGDCTDIETLIDPAPISRSRFLETVNAITPRGRTPLSASVEQAAQVLNYRENRATVILISDGIENCAADPCAVAEQLAQQGIGFTTHVIGFDIATDDHERLSCIAENTGGIFVPASDADELAQAVTQVQQTIAQEPVSEPQPEPEPVELGQVEVTAPPRVVAGSIFDVSWSEAFESRDYVTIVPAGAQPSDYGSYVYVREDLTGTLTAQIDPGLYEVRYVTADSNTVLGGTSVEIVPADIEIFAPESTGVGSRFDVNWTVSVHPRDYVTIVPLGADEGTYRSYAYVGDDLEANLTAPGDPGAYEVRYVSDVGSRTLASAPIEVVEATVSISGPDTVTTGARINVEWSETIDRNDFVAIVPMGADAGDLGTSSTRTGQSGTSAELTAPANVGMYELRYILNEGRGTLASAPIEVVEASVTIEGPGVPVRAGDNVDVSWSETIDRNDFIAIVPMGSEQSDVGRLNRRAGQTTSTRFTAPDEVGLYEIRYILNEGRIVLASDSFEVVAADAPLDEGAGLTAPDRVAPGAPIAVTWQAQIEGARVSLARADQADFTWIEARAADSEGATQFTAPDEPGSYEVRFLDIASQAVMGRAIVVVE